VENTGVVVSRGCINIHGVIHIIVGWTVEVIFQSLYCCTVHLDINVYVYQLMHIFIKLREH